MQDRLDAMASGGMGHFSADPSAPTLVWRQTATFGSGSVKAVGLVEYPGGHQLTEQPRPASPERDALAPHQHGQHGEA